MKGSLMIVGVWAVWNSAGDLFAAAVRMSCSFSTSGEREPAFEAVMLF